MVGIDDPTVKMFHSWLASVTNRGVSLTAVEYVDGSMRYAFEIDPPRAEGIGALVIHHPRAPAGEVHEEKKL